MIYSQIKVPLNNRKILNQIKTTYSNFLGKYGKSMQPGDERKKRQKYGSDIIYHMGCFWYGLYKVELIPKTYERMNGISSHSL